MLCTTPTYALHLAEVAAEEKIDLSAGNVSTIIVAGEPGGSIPATRAHIEQLWPRRQGCGSSWDDGDRSRQLRMSRAPRSAAHYGNGYFPEVIDPVSLEPVEPGGSGELVLTNLGRVGSPLRDTAPATSYGVRRTYSVPAVVRNCAWKGEFSGEATTW